MSIKSLTAENKKFLRDDYGRRTGRENVNITEIRKELGLGDNDTTYLKLKIDYNARNLATIQKIDEEKHKHRIEQIKLGTKRWRQNNRDHYNSQMLDYMNARYDSEKRRKLYLWKLAKTEFLGILL